MTWQIFYPAAGAGGLEQTRPTFLNAHYLYHYRENFRQRRDERSVTQRGLIIVMSEQFCNVFIVASVPVQLTATHTARLKLRFNKQTNVSNSKRQK